MALTPEGRVKEAIKKILKAHGIFYYMPMSNGMGQVGAPDFLCCFNGRFWAVEAKAPGKRDNTTANQDRVIDAINAAGGVAIVVDDAKQLEELILHA